MKSPEQLPNWVNRLIRRLCGDFIAEGIQGDLLENFCNRTQSKGAGSARFWLFLELLLLCRFIFYRKEKTTYKNSNIMFREYFKIGYRVILRNKVFSFINLFGLGLGMASTLLIFLWVSDELSYDRFHTNVDQLYRVEFDQGNINTNAGGPGELGPTISEQVPELERVSRYSRGRGSYILQNEEQVYHEESYALVDPDFFRMFSFDFVSGDAGKALDDPYGIVLTQSLANKYFGDQNALGSVLKLNNEHLMTVTGIVADPPANSSFQFDFVLPIEFLKITGQYTASWSTSWLNTYVQIPEGTDLEGTAKKALSLIRDKHNRWNKENVTGLVFNPLRTMRLKAYSYTGSGVEQKNLQAIYTFSALAILILLIACINFMNLSTARTARRAKEIGMRKVVGAVKGNIRSQFLGESLLQSAFALVLAVLLVALLLAPFNQISGKQLDLSALLNLKFAGALIAVTLIVSLVAGSYPAFYLSSFQPIKVLKGHLSAGVKSRAFRKVLVVAQFGMSIFLIIGTLVIYYQMNYIRNKDLGYNKEQVLYIPLIHADSRKAFSSLKASWLSLPEVAMVTSAQLKPSIIGWNSNSHWKGKDPEDYEDTYHNRVDRDYLATLDIEILEGRDFTPEFQSDVSAAGRGGFIINETLAKKMAPEGSSVGMQLALAGTVGPVVGVMNDFHFRSLKNTIHPLALILSPASRQHAIIKMNPTKLQAALSQMEEVWNEVLPEYPFEYHFLDEDFDQLYKTEARLGKLLASFSVLAIVIACLGLFGLSSFMAEERRKEVAIRKVLGASHTRIAYLLCKDFMLLVLLANLVALPFGNWIMGDWLAGFAYRINLGVEIFLLASSLALVTAFLTIIFHILKAIFVNPVFALKHE